MKGSTFIIDLVSTVALLSCTPGASAHQDGFWQRLRRGLGKEGKGVAGERSELQSAGGSTFLDEATAYPYGYPPPGGGSTVTITVDVTVSTTGELSMIY